MIIGSCMKSMNTIRLAVPVQVREALQLTRGSRVIWEVVSPGECRIRSIDYIIKKNDHKQEAA